MIKNQYILSSEKLSSFPENYESLSFADLNLYKDNSLKHYIYKDENVEFLLMGFIVDPFNPLLTSNEIVLKLGEIQMTSQLFQVLENFSGRYIILYKNLTDCLMIHDMFGQRQINYQTMGEGILVSSSVKLLIHCMGREIDFIDNHSDLFHDKGFQLFDQWFLGDLTWDRNIKKLLPNFYLDLNTKSIRRIPFHEIEIMKKKEVIEYSNQIVRGNFEAILNRYDNVFQALTAGFDSRTLLAQSQNSWERIQFYTFERGDTNSKRDAKIAKELSEKFKFNYGIKKKLDRNSDFENYYKSQFIIPRTTPKYYNVLYFKQFKDVNSINITGDGVQMVRNLRSPSQLKNAETLFNSLNYTHHTFHLENFHSWLEDVKEVAEKENILISDLFTQEIAQGQLTARWSHEFDLSGCEEFNPFSHKKMIYTILKNIPIEERVGPNYHFQKELMESSVAAISSIPFNPPTWKDKIKRIMGK